MRAGRRWTAWASILALLLLLGGCALGDSGDLAQNALDPAPGSPLVEADRLWNLVFPIAAVVFVLVQSAIIFVVLRFRSKGDANEPLPKQIAGNTRLEVIWTVVPALILVFVAVPTVQTIFSLSEVEEGALNVRVIAKQYWFEFEYMDEDQQQVVVANQLHIPTGRQVQLHMQSVSQVSYNPADFPDGPIGPVAQGVIHNFWVPRLAGKTYIVPGHTRTMALETTEAGLYLGQCAEFCGLSHPNMRFSVVAEDPEDFDAWIEQQAAAAEVQEEGLAAEGQQLFNDLTCVACHAIEGYPEGGDPANDPVPIEEQARVGPNLTHFYSRDTFAGAILDVQNDDDLRAWLRNPQEQKPGAQMPNLNLSDQDIEALVAYLRTLD